MSEQWGFDTRQIHAGAEPDPTTGARATPIYQTTAYQFRDSDHAANLFALAEIGNIYTRIMNPTQGVARGPHRQPRGRAPTPRSASPEPWSSASGQAAETFAILNLAEAGSHIVASARRSTAAPTTCSTTRCPSWASRSRFVEDPDDLEAWAAAVRPNTKAFYGESIGNPRNDILDIAAVAECRPRQRCAADRRQHRRHAVPAQPARSRRRHRRALRDQVPRRPRHGDRRGDRRRRHRSTSPRTTSSRMFTEPDASYHGLAYWPALGAGSYIIKARVQLLRDIGAAISPFNAFLLIQGIETLSLRMDRHVANAQAVAEYLEAHAQVESVAYAGLASSPWHDRVATLHAQGRRLGAGVRHQGRPRRRQALRRGARAAQPPGEHR